MILLEIGNPLSAVIDRHVPGGMSIYWLYDNNVASYWHDWIYLKKSGVC